MACHDLTFSVDQLKVGDIVYQYEKNVLVEREIIKLENTGVKERMYNIKYVQKNNTFFANGVLVHNRFQNQ